MPDILIGRTSRLKQVHIMPETERGRLWIKANTLFEGSGSSVYVTIQAEQKEDFIEELKKAELTYNEE